MYLWAYVLPRPGHLGGVTCHTQQEGWGRGAIQSAVNRSAFAVVDRTANTDDVPAEGRSSTTGALGSADSASSWASRTAMMIGVAFMIFSLSDLSYFCGLCGLCGLGKVVTHCYWID